VPEVSIIETFIFAGVIRTLVYPGTDLEKILKTVTPGSDLDYAIDAIQRGNGSQDELRRVSTHVTNQMEQVMKKHVNG